MKNEYALKDRGESLCNERARQRIESKASLITKATSFGNNRRLIGTLNVEISDSSQLSSLLGELRMMSISANAAALPRLLLPRKEAGEVIDAR